MPRKPRSKKAEELPRRAPGAGSIQRLPDGRLRARLPARVDPKRTAREFPRDGIDAASAWLDMRVFGRTVALSGLTPLGDWAGQWWEHHVLSVLAPNTVEAYLRALKRLDMHRLLALQDVLGIHLQEIVGKMKHLDPATLHNTVGVWRRMFQAAVQDGLILRNPTYGLTLPARRKPDPPRSLTQKEIGLLWAGIGGERFEVAYALMLGCALRIGEILGLHWRNVDLGKGRAWVEDQYTNHHWRERPKGRNSHWIPLPPDVVAVLIRHHDQQPPGSLLVMQSPYSDPKNPKPWAVSTVRADLAKLVKRLELDHLTPHAGRHGMASYLISRGVSPAEVARRLGHSSPAITLRAYTHPTEDAESLASGLVDQLLSGSREKDDLDR